MMDDGYWIVEEEKLKAQSLQLVDKGKNSIQETLFRKLGSAQCPCHMPLELIQYQVSSIQYRRPYTLCHTPFVLSQNSLQIYFTALIFNHYAQIPAISNFPHKTLFC
jgi:hypothetical protein